MNRNKLWKAVSKCPVHNGAIDTHGDKEKSYTCAEEMKGCINCPITEAFLNCEKPTIIELKLEISKNDDERARLMLGKEREKSTQGMNQFITWMEKSFTNHGRYIGPTDFGNIIVYAKKFRDECLPKPSPDPQTQVQQLIQWAKDNGYGLAAEWIWKQCFIDGKEKP